LQISQRDSVQRFYQTIAHLFPYATRGAAFLVIAGYAPFFRDALHR
jgi:hypothetical protein